MNKSVLKLQPDNERALRLMRDGGRALAVVEAAGVRVDVARLEATILETGAKIQFLEVELLRDAMWKQWKGKFGDRAKLGSKEQLAEIVFNDMGYPVEERTPTGMPKADEAAFADIPIPFVKNYFRWQKLDKLYSTYLLNLKRNTINGYLHPNFNLHTVSTFRSSSGKDKEDDVAKMSGADFNLQNVPVRVSEIGREVRKNIIPRPGHVLLEIDYGRIEVHGNAWYSHDDALMRYLTDLTTDMHRDQAMALFMLALEDASEKGVRYTAKNQFVFAEFYGSVAFQCAKALWKMMERLKLTVRSTGLTLRQHLADKGIKTLGECDPQRRPMPGTFAYHVMCVERDMWQLFAAHDAWRESWWRQYLKDGGFVTLTGFALTGLMKRNVVINTPVQGVAFHCLLQDVIWLVDWLTHYKMRSKLIGQIHDCMFIDCHEAELQDVIQAALFFMTKRLPKEWSFICTPLEAEVEVAEENWHGKNVWHQNDGGLWVPKKKKVA